MTTITAHDLASRLEEVFAGIADGRAFLVIDRGRPVARILPPEIAELKPQETAEEWVARWYAWTDGHEKRDIAIDDSRDAIYAGCGE